MGWQNYRHNARNAQYRARILVVQSEFEPRKLAQTSEQPLGLLLVLFAISGATGLVDQLCFSRYLSYVMGSTAYAVSAVLAAFMTGLALGAALGGRFSARIQRPLVAYGILEIVVGLAVATTPSAFDHITPLYANLARSAPHSLLLLSSLRWLLALLVVILPTVAMGATLPLLSRLTERLSNPELPKPPIVNALYAANTYGGAFGALLAAYLILPVLGANGTLFASAAVSGAVGLLAIGLGRNLRHTHVERQNIEEADFEAEISASERVERIAVAFLSGAFVFAAEVLFTHLLALIIGNSVYAFGLILTIFLLCLAIGASVAPRFEGRFGPLALPLGLVLGGVTLAYSLVIWDKLPFLFDNTGSVVTSFAGRELIRAVAAGLALFVPTTLMGFTFPLLLGWVSQQPAHVSRDVGKLTSVNTLGAVFGSLFTGYWLLPHLGSERSLQVLATAFALLGFAVFMRRRELGTPVGNAWVQVLALVTLVSSWVMPAWDLARLTSGGNVYFDGYHEPDAVLMLREDVHGGVTSVTSNGDILTLYTNGKFQGNNGWELNAQRFFAHYPSLFVPEFERLLVIGLGTGTTLGTFTGYPWKNIDVAEISPAIWAAADRYFRGPNRAALDDPRVHMHHADGRNFLLISDHKYDLISIELSSIWFAGAANLYSREFYELVHEHLAPRGVFQQWVQLHHIERESFATILNTLRQVFAHVALFYGGGQGILVASQTPLAASAGRLAALQASPTLAEIVPEKRELLQLLNDVLVVDQGLDAFLDESAQLAGKPRTALISTDQNLYLEYATPKGNVLPWATRETLVAALRRFQNRAAIQQLTAP